MVVIFACSPDLFGRLVRRVSVVLEIVFYGVYLTWFMGRVMGRKKRKVRPSPAVVHPSVPGMGAVTIQRTTHVEIVVSGPRPSPEEVDKLISEKTLSREDALEFYEALAEDVRKLYGTDDLDELERLARESEDLWLEEHVWDLRMYHALKG